MIHTKLSAEVKGTASINLLPSCFGFVFFVFFCVCVALIEGDDWSKHAFPSNKRLRIA